MVDQDTDNDFERSDSMLRKVIVAPDSYKGSLSAREAADIIADEIALVCPNCSVVKIPIADGGEGSVETIIDALGGRTVKTRVLSADEREITAHYGITSDERAILEVAQSSGITRQIGLHPMTSSTYGFGQLISSALDKGLRDFILCIGGSATTDGGCGMAAALGVTFLDDKNSSFVPNGATLPGIARIDIAGLDTRVRESTFSVMCDVDNPLFGPNGASVVYAPQKGADPTQVRALDSGLRHLSEVVRREFDSDLSDVGGAGASGGLGFGCMVFLGAKLVSGIDVVLDISDFDTQVADSDLIITGEGKLDGQSFSGKVLSGIMRHAKEVPIATICGVCDVEEDELNKRGVRAFETSTGVSVEESLKHPEKYMRRAVDKVIDTMSDRAEPTALP
ncbi:MAG: glycerate kinase [Coriobacteriia bacterium]|nr:glycerate kinase [Coriobacteriia bacterium]